MAATVFRKSVLGGVPAFFDAKLHEDTDFGDIDWEKAETDHIPIHYAIRAWERLELMMSKLEKPFDRHRFYRLKMRARRRTDHPFLRMLSWLFETTADYGWGVGRAFTWWVWPLGYVRPCPIRLFHSSEHRLFFLDQGVENRSSRSWYRLR